MRFTGWVWGHLVKRIRVPRFFGDTKGRPAPCLDTSSESTKVNLVPIDSYVVAPICARTPFNFVSRYPGEAAVSRGP